MSTVPSVSTQISFEHVVLDKDTMGHRQVADMDGDGDCDIISAARDNYKFLHLWRNDSKKGQRR